MRKLGYFLLSFVAVLFVGSVAQAAMMDDDQGGDKKFSIHGEIRFRGEWWDNLTDFTGTDPDLDFGDETNDSFDIFPYRVRLAAKGDLGHDVWVYGEFQGVGVAGGGAFGATDPFFGDDTEVINSGVTMYQGFVKLKDVGKSVVDLTFGRQEIVFDRGLQFSALDFYNGISHDGVMAAWDWDNFSIHGFWVQNFESNLFATALSASSDADDNTYGAHFKHMVGKDHDQDVAYYLFLQRLDDFMLDEFPDPNSGDTVRHGDKTMLWTLGGRWGHMVSGKNGWSWNAELAYQFGDVQPCAGLTTIAGVFTTFPSACLEDTLDQKAWVFEGSLGYTWHNGKTDQKFWGGTTWASGDDDPNDDSSESYWPLYTDFHNRLGNADLFALTNIQAWYLGYKVNMDDKHIFGATLYDFSQDATEAGTFSPLTFGSTGNGLADACFDDSTPPSGDDCSDDLGQELDLYYDYNLTENFSFNTALSWFEPGDAIEDHWSDFGNFDGWGTDAAWRLTLQARARF